jgi:hypothetical protein
MMGAPFVARDTSMNPPEWVDGSLSRGVGVQFVRSVS